MPAAALHAPPGPAGTDARVPETGQHVGSVEGVTVDPAAVNHWSDARCAKAFWSQTELPVFRRLVSDTLDDAAPASGEHWLDLGCGGGTLTRGLWDRTRGTVGRVVGLDTAAANAGKYADFAAKVWAGDRVEFRHGDFSHGLGGLPAESFDHAISGLSISYAEHFDPQTGRWTQQAYDRLLADVCRVLKPGGRFVFSVNVPDPSWWAVGLRSLAGAVWQSGRPVKFLKNAARMMRYGAWLKREARAGRFHYLPADVTADKLARAGFARVTHRLSYAGQAFVFRAEKGA